MADIDVVETKTDEVAEDFKQRVGKAEEEINNIFEKYGVVISPQIVYSNTGIGVKVVFIDTKETTK